MVAIRVGHEWTQICEKCRSAFGVMNNTSTKSFPISICTGVSKTVVFFFWGGVCWGIWKRVSPSSTSNISLKMFNSSTSRAFTIILWACRILCASSKIKSVMDHFFFICALALPGLQKKCDSIWVAPTPSHRGLCNFTRDKTGFKPRIGTEPVLAMFECICGKSLGWNASVWFASFGIPKAFDRVEYDPAVGSTNADRILFLAFGFVSTPARCTWSWAFIFNAAWGEANWCHQFLFLILLIVLTMVQYGLIFNAATPHAVSSGTCCPSNIHRAYVPIQQLIWACFVVMRAIASVPLVSMAVSRT